MADLTLLGGQPWTESTSLDYVHVGSGEIHPSLWERHSHIRRLTMWEISPECMMSVPFTQLSSLREISITDCGGLTCIPAIIGHLELDSLHIYGCRQLASLCLLGPGPRALTVAHCYNLRSIQSLAGLTRLEEVFLAFLPALRILPALPAECTPSLDLSCLETAQASVFSLLCQPLKGLNVCVCPLLQLQLARQPYSLAQSSLMRQLVTFVVASYAARRRRRAAMLPPELLLLVAGFVCPAMQDVTVYTATPAALPAAPLSDLWEQD
jgi:hypothetical protein